MIQGYRELGHVRTTLPLTFFPLVHLHKVLTAFHLLSSYTGTSICHCLTVVNIISVDNGLSFNITAVIYHLDQYYSLT